MLERIKDKEILVIGMARSGMAAVQLLAEMGAAKIIAADRKQASEMHEETARLSRYPAVEVVTGGTSSDLATPGLSMVIKSPGVPPDLEVIKRAEAMQVPIYSEVELAYAFLKAPLIGVTGTNGKTTTTSMIAAMLKEARFDPVVAAGNIGNPLCGVVGSISAQGMIVAELSSFQLENIDRLRPLVAVFLNFGEDHIDYHKDLDKYFAAKARIFENQLESDYAVLNGSDARVASLAGACKSRVLWFDTRPVKRGIGVSEGRIALFNPGCAPRTLCPVNEVSLPGEHNLENALAASAAAWAAGADPEAIAAVLRSFQAIEHRLEFVATINGVDYINDSKGTNPGSTMKALQSFPGRRKILIAGGKEKGSDFGELAGMITREVGSLIVYGETRDRLVQAARRAGFENYCIAAGLEEAVKRAYQLAAPGDLVLLSPACASWDMFPSYEVRGDLFKKLVHDLQSGREEEGSAE